MQHNWSSNFAFGLSETRTNNNTLLKTETNNSNSNNNNNHNNMDAHQTDKSEINKTYNKHIDTSNNTKYSKCNLLKQ